MAPFFERSHSVFKLNALIVAEMDILADKLTGMSDGSDFVSVDAIGFENTKEILSWGVIGRDASP